MDDQAAKHLIAAIAAQFAEDTTYLRTAGYMDENLRISPGARQALLKRHREKAKTSLAHLVGTMDLSEALYVEHEWQNGMAAKLSALVANAGMDAPNAETWRRAAAANIGDTLHQRRQSRDEDISDQGRRDRDYHRRRRQTKNRVKEFRDCELDAIA